MNRFPRPRRRRVPASGAMTREERIFAIQLDAQKAAGEILSWSFESHTFHLAGRQRYTPDFEIVHHDRITYVEVKATRRPRAKDKTERDRVLWTEDSRVKWKQAAALFPHFEWVAAYWFPDLGWQYEEAPPSGGYVSTEL